MQNNNRVILGLYWGNGKMETTIMGSGCSHPNSGPSESNQEVGYQMYLGIRTVHAVGAAPSTLNRVLRCAQTSIGYCVVDLRWKDNTKTRKL